MYSRALLASQITCRPGVQAGHWVWTCLFATYQRDRYHKRVGWCMCVGRRGSTRGVTFLAIFSGHKQYLNFKQYIKQYQAMQFNATSRDFAKAIIAQKSLVLSLGPAGCLEATDRQHVRFRQGERCERRWGPIVPNEAVPVEEDGSSSGSCYLDWHGLADYVTIMFYIILLYIISTFYPIGRRSTRSGEVTRIFRNIFKYMFYFVLACWMAAIQGYGRLCWHFCSVHEWLQPQLQQPWGLARKVCVGFGRCRPHHESKAHSGTSCCKRFTSILMMYILEPLELENYSKS